MEQATLEMKEPHPGILTTALRQGGNGDTGLLENTARILDSLIPLRNASHADVVEYRVQIPMRYAECIAVLFDGRTVKFAEPRKFLGWSSHEERRSLLFRHHGITLEVEVDNLAAERARSTVRRINLQAAFREGASRLKKFIGIDGGLIIVPAA